MTRKFLMLGASAMMALPLLASPANATGPTASIAFPSGGVNFDNGSQQFDLSDPTMPGGAFSITQQNVGGFSAQSSSGVPIINVAGAVNLFWCTDLPQDLAQTNSQVTYTFGSVTDGLTPARYPATPDATKANQITNILYNTEVNQTSGFFLDHLTDGVISSAVQLAIWTILYETGDSGYSLSGALKTTCHTSCSTAQNSALSDAATILANATAGSNGAWTPTPNGYSPVNLENNPNGQSIIVLTGGPATNVPEPSSFALLAAGLLGLFGIQRLRRSA